jgi:hypothetical protein
MAIPAARPPTVPGTTPALGSNLPLTSQIEARLEALAQLIVMGAAFDSDFKTRFATGEWLLAGDTPARVCG